MEKLKTFTIYLLIIVGFFLVSSFLENSLLAQMYEEIYGTVEESFEYNGAKTALDVEIVDARATNVNGYLIAKVTNNTDNTIGKAYLKIDLLAKKRLKAVTRYMEINNLKPGETKEYELKFRAGYVDSYKVAVKDDFPDEDYIFEIFGYEINTKSVFGIDVSDYIDAKAIKDSGFNGVTSIFQFFGVLGHRFVIVAKSVPWWGYLGAALVISGIL